MAEISGYCLKCKTYGPIKDGKLVKMKTEELGWEDFVLSQDAMVKYQKLLVD